MSDRSAPPSPGQLHGRVAIVTGASAGLGFAIAQALVARGMSVAAVARDAERLASAVDHLDLRSGGRVMAVPGDVGDPQTVEAIVARVVERFSGLDTLVNCAGESPLEHRPLVDAELADWQRMLATNLTGVFLLSRAALPHIAQASDGYVVNVLSTVAHVPAPGAALYAATKQGALGLTQSLLEEYRGSAVRISSVSPGKMDTSVWDRMAAPPTRAERDAMMDPADVADVVAWLIERPARLHIPHLTIRPWSHVSQTGGGPRQFVNRSAGGTLRT